MKQLVAFLFLLVSTQAFAQDRFLDNTSVIDLATAELELTVKVSYPMPAISGVCAIEIVADAYGRRVPVENLLSALNITNAFDPSPIRSVEVISDKAVRIRLFEGFIDGVVISSKDGSSLIEVIKRTLGENRKVVLLPRSC